MEDYYEYKTYFSLEKVCINTSIVLVIVLVLVILFKSVLYVKNKSTVKRIKYSVQDVLVEFVGLIPEEGVEVESTSRIPLR